MQRITVICPTRNRYEKLMKMIASLPEIAAGIPVEPLVIFDADPIGYERYRRAAGAQASVLLSHEHRGSVFCRNLAIRHCDDAIIYAVDDMTFDKGAIEIAALDMIEHFGDDDGVIGFSQRGNAFHPSAVGLVGRPFIKRYPEQQLFCPQYFHFAAQEIYRFAMLSKRFFLSKASIYHYHPATHRELIDKTHHEARAFKAKDMAVRAARERMNLIWGAN